jgi:hypothetical protein
MRIVSTEGVEAFNREGVDYAVEDDGSFEVPEEVGVELLSFPGWLLQYEAADLAAEEQAEHDVDPAVLAAAHAALEARVAELEAENRKLRAAKASAHSTAGVTAPRKPAAKKAPAKKAPAKKAPAKAAR